MKNFRENTDMVAGNSYQSKKLWRSGLTFRVLAMIILAAVFALTGCERKDEVVPQSGDKQTKQTEPALIYKGRSLQKEEFSKMDRDKLIFVVEPQADKNAVSRIQVFDTQQDFQAWARTIQGGQDLLALDQQVREKAAQARQKTDAQLKAEYEATLKNGASARAEAYGFILYDYANYYGYTLTFYSSIANLGWYSWSNRASAYWNSTNRWAACFDYTYYSGSYFYAAPYSYSNYLGYWWDNRVSSVWIY